ncbi:ArsR family transcriptional regulator [Deinococcus fonticola]|uniref:ArsR family transcriptional regulator n=1 Tax=Deinococcus fonticola TaxID=2528713 RepID=UPI00142FC438|nr:ArsR family transcriptional regulator [Deinococcus fonticola]
MSTAHVATAPQAKLLLAVELRPLLNLLMREPRTVTEAAVALGMNVQRTHYLMGKLLKAGVAEVAAERRRSGPPVKVYRVPPHWFIPLESTSAESLEAFVNAQVQPRIEKLVREILQVFRQRRSEQQGFWLSDGNLSLGDVNGAAQDLWEGQEPVVFTLGQVRVSRTRATEFKRQLIAMTQEFEQAPDEQAAVYRFAVMVVRDQETG